MTMTAPPATRRRLDLRAGEIVALLLVRLFLLTGLFGFQAAAGL